MRRETQSRISELGLIVGGVMTAGALAFGAQPAVLVVTTGLSIWSGFVYFALEYWDSLEQANAA